MYSKKLLINTDINYALQPDRIYYVYGRAVICQTIVKIITIKNDKSS